MIDFSTIKPGEQLYLLMGEKFRQRIFVRTERPHFSAVVFIHTCNEMGAIKVNRLADGQEWTVAQAHLVDEAGREQWRKDWFAEVEKVTLQAVVKNMALPLKSTLSKTKRLTMPWRLTIKELADKLGLDAADLGRLIKKAKGYGLL